MLKASTMSLPGLSIHLDEVMSRQNPFDVYSESYGDGDTLLELRPPVK